MIADPLTITIGGVAIDLAKINQDVYSSEWLYQSALKKYVVKIRHSKMKAEADGRQKERHNFQIAVTTFATATDLEAYDEFNYTLVGYPGNVDIAVGLACGVLNAASSGAFLTKLRQWQS